MNNLPQGWTVAPIASVAAVNQRNPKLRDLPDALPVTFVPMAAVDAVSGTIAKPEIRPLGEVRRGYTSFQPGDVLFAKITPCMENGKAAVATALTNDVGFGSTEFHVISPSPSVTSEWIYYFIRQESFRSDAKANFSGTAGQLRVPSDFVASAQLPVPPLEEQRRIVAAIETHFTRLDAAVAALKRVQSNLRRYRAAVLKAACEGRLVPTEAELARQEGRPYEPGAALLERVLAERRAQWQVNHPGKKYKEPAGPDVSELPELPEGWCWATWEQLSPRVTVGHVGSMKDEYIDEGIPFLRSQNVRENRFDPAGLMYISTQFHEKLAKSALQPGDLVVTRSGSVGVTCVVPATLPVANCSDLVIVKKPRAVLSKFGAYFMNSLAKREIARGSVGVALTHFNTQSVAEMAVCVPPLAEQHRIVAEAENRLSMIDSTERDNIANLHRANRLRQSILQRAFSGQLNV